MSKIKIKSVITFEIDPPRIPTDITLSRTQLNDFIREEAESVLNEYLGGNGLFLEVLKIRIAQTKGENNE